MTMKEQILSFIDKYPNGLIFIVGPTASGKTKLSIDLIRQWIPAEVISADSRQIYRYMDIWTDKISKSIREEIPHYLIDILNPDEFYTAADRKKDALSTIQKIHQKWKIPFVVGGTWLYTDTIYKNYSLPDAPCDFEFRKKMYELEEKQPWILWEKLNQIDPQEAAKLHKNSTRYIIRALEIYEKTGKPKSEVCYEQPVPFPILMIVKWADKEVANPKINARIEEMFKEWLVQEVENLLNMGYDETCQWMQSIGYKEIIPYIKGEYSLDKAKELLKRNTHRYAKKQRIFFKRYIMDMKAAPKENVEYILLNS